jgi:hypothetical protein
MPAKLNVKVKKTGRLRTPQLDQGQLTFMGNAIVVAQKQRWAAGINAEGNVAKPLSKRYAFYKSKVTGQTHPKRDMRLFGTAIENFQLRKAVHGTIRAENTTRQARRHAAQAQRADQMIGFAGSDQIKVFGMAQGMYSGYCRRAWVPIDG